MNYSWFGQAYVPGSDVVINGNYAGGYADGYEHEVGHNLGMHHANSPTAEYGDHSCIMGGYAGRGWRHFNGPHKVQMSWAPVTSASAGTYTLNAVESQPTSWSAPDVVLKIRDTVASQDLYVSYRAPIGSYAGDLNVPHQTSVHTWPGGASKTILLASIGDGGSFTRNNITIRQVSHAANNAVVEISTACVRAAPSVSVSPVEQLSSTVQGKAYTVTIRNNDVNCSPAVVSLSARAPSSTWLQAFSVESLTLASGASGTSVLTLTPPQDVVTGSHDTVVSANTDGRTSGQGNARYTFDAAAPTSPSSVSASVTRSNVSVSWSAGSDVGSGVAAYEVYRSGMLIGKVTGTTMTDQAPAGSYTYTVKAVDRAGNI